MAIITKKFTNLANGKTWYARMYPVNGVGCLQSVLTGQTASAETKEPPKELILLGEGQDTNVSGGWNKYTDSVYPASSTVTIMEKEIQIYVKGYVVDEDNNERRSGYGAASTKNLVDVTPFNKMKVVFSNTTGYPPSMALKTSPPYDQAAFIKEHYHANTAEWDISAISGSFYVCVGDWESYNRSYTNRVTQIILTQ